MVDRLKLALSSDKVETLTPTVAGSTRTRYRTGWTAWRDFCPVVEISPLLYRAIIVGGGIWLYFPTWGRKVMGAVFSWVLARCAEIRFPSVGCVIWVRRRFAYGVSSMLSQD